MTEIQDTDPPRRQPLPLALGYCLLNWLVPGAGFLAVRDWARGVGILVLINGVFLLGLAYDGYLVIPALSPRDPSFNIFAALTFIVQLWHGGGCLLLYTAESIGGPLGTLLVRNPGGAYSDLGIFHFAVAGGLNYFATVRLWDLMRPGQEQPTNPTSAEHWNRGEGDGSWGDDGGGDGGGD